MVAATISQVVMDANTVTTIMNNINTLYSNAFSQLIAVTIGILTLGGVVLPLIISYFQKRNIKADHEELTRIIGVEIQTAKKVLFDEIKSGLQEEKELIDKKIIVVSQDIKSEINLIRAGANAKIYHMITITNVDTKRYARAFLSCAEALPDYAIVKDESNMQILLNNLLRADIIPNLKKADFVNDDRLEKRFKLIVDCINGLNANGRYAQDLIGLKAEFGVALQRS